MSRHYKYTVLIRLSRNGSNNLLKNIDIEYPYSGNATFKDNLIVKESLLNLFLYEVKQMI